MTEPHVNIVRYRAVEAFKAGDYGKAAELFNEVVELSDHPFDRLWHGVTLQLIGRDTDASVVYEHVLRENPAEPMALHHLAHIKATSEDSAIRDGKMAIELAKRLCKITGWQNWVNVSVLAAAHAESEEWEQAERFAVMALELAPDEEKQRRQERLAQYQEKQKFRSSPQSNRLLLIQTRQLRK